MHGLQRSVGLQLAEESVRSFQYLGLHQYRSNFISDTRPPVPKHNQLWWESDTGLLFIWYDDGNSQQWVQVTPGPVVVDGVSIVGGGVKTDPLRVGLVDCGTY